VGLGLYDLQGDQATRTGEWIEGIGRLWEADDIPAAAGYMDVIRHISICSLPLRQTGCGVF
jgi:23S rRNA (adenine2030-N6)-methyltransferase